MRNAERLLRASRRCSQACAAFLCSFLILAGCTARPPDVVLIVIDTLRADHLAVYGYQRETAPNLTRFARDAIVYEQATSPGTWTVPSHGSMLTGRWPSYHGAERVPGDRILAMPINPDLPVLSEVLREHGYRTGAFIGNSTYLAGIFGFSRGFDDYVTGDFWHANAMVGPLITWLHESRQKTFLLWNVIDPHEPYDPPAPFDSKFPGRRPEHGTMLTELARAGVQPTREMIEHFVSQYDGEIAVADDAIGKVLDTLRQQGRYEGALIFVTSDHGELFGEWGSFGHGTVPFEPMVHVPLLVKLPGNRRAGEHVSRRVSTAAIFATVLRELGLPLAELAESPSLDQEHAVWVEDIDHLGGRIRVGYGDNGKLFTRESKAGIQAFYYDLTLDPGESHPILDEGAGAELRAALASFASAPRPPNLANVPMIDAEHEAKLRALGYVR